MKLWADVRGVRLGEKAVNIEQTEIPLPICCCYCARNKENNNKVTMRTGFMFQHVAKTNFRFLRQFYTYHANKRYDI